MAALDRRKSPSSIGQINGLLRVVFLTDPANSAEKFAKYPPIGLKKFSRQCSCNSYLSITERARATDPAPRFSSALADLGLWIRLPAKRGHAPGGALVGGARRVVTVVAGWGAVTPTDYSL